MPNVTAVPVEIGNAVPAAAVEPIKTRPAATSETYLPDERAILATYLPSFLRVCASLARWPSRPPLPAAAASFAAGMFLPRVAPRDLWRARRLLMAPLIHFFVGLPLLR